jgi:hypothetical protein
MMYENKRKDKKRKEKETEAKQITARKPKSNERKKKKSNITSLDGNRTRQPSKPCHPLPHLPKTPSNIQHPTSNIRHPTSHIQHPSTYKYTHIHIHIHISTITHTHPPQQITHSIYKSCCAMKHRSEATYIMEARLILKI